MKAFCEYFASSGNLALTSVPSQTRRDITSAEMAACPTKSWFGLRDNCSQTSVVDSS